MPDSEKITKPVSVVTDEQDGIDDDDEVGGETATFVEHLEELRTRLIRALVYIVAGASLTFAVGHQVLMGVILHPILKIAEEFPDKVRVVNTAPAEFFFVWCKILLIGGVFLATPAVLIEIYGFVGPALTRAEKAYARWALLFAPALFAAGVTFGYVVIPIGLRWLIKFSLDYGVDQFIAIKEYLSFLLTLMLGLGLVFQMPLLTAVLTKLDIVEWRFLAEKRRYAIVILAIVAAIITPTPDIVNLSIVMVPMLALFELSIIISRIVGRGPQERTRAKSTSRRRFFRRAKDVEDVDSVAPPEDRTD